MKMRKMRFIGIAGALLVIAIVLVLKMFNKSSVFAIPFLLPFLVMILIDISGGRKNQ
jgi:tryptophan-rich sensory protein